MDCTSRGVSMNEVRQTEGKSAGATVQEPAAMSRGAEERGAPSDIETKLLGDAPADTPEELEAKVAGKVLAGTRGASAPVKQAAVTVGIVALVLVLAFVFQLAQFPAPVIGVIVVVAIVMFALVLVNPHVVRTQAGRALVYTWLAKGQPVRVMRLGGVYQSATYLGFQSCEPVFKYIKAFDVVFDAEDAVRAATGHGVERVLALGGGGFSWPKHAILDHDCLHVDVVEIDPAIIQAARRWFYLDMIERYAGRRLRVHEGDGRAVLDKRARRLEAGEPNAQRYDAVVNDTFSGGEPVRELATVEAAQAVHTCLNPGGVYATNVVARDDDTSVLRNTVATLSQVFAHVHVIPVEEDAWASDDNYIVVATDGGTQFSGTVPFDEEFLGEVLRDR